MNVMPIALSSISFDDVWNEIQKPFDFGTHMLVKAFDTCPATPLSLVDRVTCFFQGLVLWIPLVNIIALKVLGNGAGLVGAPSRYETVSLPSSIPPRFAFTGNVDMANDQVEDYFNLLLQKYPERKIYLHQYEMITLQNIAARIPATFSRDHNELIYLVRMNSLAAGRGHWGIVYIDRNLRTVEFYNSKYPYNEEPQIVEHLQRIAQQLSSADPGRPYVFQQKLQKRLQPDTYQCGPWVCYFLENRLVNPAVDFNLLDTTEAQLMIADFRNRVLSKFIEARAQGLI